MAYRLIRKLDSGVRIGELETAHGKIHTPFFMPVGTVGSVKGIAPDELREMGAEIILCNTYHLYLRPGEKLVKESGGLHRFINWDRPILTDSGGYQVFSLGNSDRGQGTSDKGHKENSRTIENLVKITEEGAEFKSHLDGSKHMFTPEKVIEIQLDLGVDILMPLDVCPSGKATKEEIREACELTIRWAKRSKDHFELMTKEMDVSKRPMLHGIVQGGLYPDLREWCAKGLMAIDFDGYSVGGLAVDLETREMWEVVKLMGQILPENKQRYLMGVGTPDDIVKATSLGMDMFDCVLPTRMARHGSVYVNSQQSAVSSQQLAGTGECNQFQTINLLNAKYKTEYEVIEKGCDCYTCRQGFTKAYISHLLRSKEMLGMRLATLHNLWQYLELMRKIGCRENKLVS